MTTYEDLLASLSEQERAQVTRRANQLIREEKVRRSMGAPGSRAKREGEPASGVLQQLQRLDARGDMSVGALRRQVAAFRGKLRVTVEIEGRKTIELKRLGRGRGS